jgi:hypothetical protein
LALPVAPVTHQPAPGDTQDNVSRQLAEAVVLGGGAAPAPPPAGSGRSALRFFNSSGLVKRAVPKPSRAARQGLAGMAELRVLVPGGGRRRSKTRLSFPKRANRRTNGGMHDLGGNAQSQAQAGVAASNHRPLITLDTSKAFWGVRISAKRNNLLLRRLRPGPPELMAAIYMRHET